MAPMPLMTYEQVRPWARSIKSKVLKKEMPPWGIGESTLKFSNDRQMSEKEIFTLVAWVDAGAPKGNDADLPAPPPQQPHGVITICPPTPSSHCCDTDVAAAEIYPCG